MSTDVKRLITVLAALLLAALTTATARAADGDGPSTGQRIASALRTSPVYVDDAYTDAVPPSRQRQLADRIRSTGLPIKVVLTPLTKGDAFAGDSEVLAGIVRDRFRTSANSSSSRRTATSPTPWRATSGPPTPTRRVMPWPRPDSWTRCGTRGWRT
ncbi:hypothetical protein [Streptomyces coeruleorubidus]|uniref:hypothetical protein n=1 Tax=Streptomyces coeruleorubidus TaxID=116188 RepID=UPI0033B1D9AD